MNTMINIRRDILLRIFVNVRETHISWCVFIVFTTHPKMWYRQTQQTRSKTHTHTHIFTALYSESFFTLLQIDKCVLCVWLSMCTYIRTVHMCVYSVVGCICWCAYKNKVNPKTIYLISYCLLYVRCVRFMRTRASSTQSYFLWWMTAQSWQILSNCALAYPTEKKKKEHLQAHIYFMDARYIWRILKCIQLAKIEQKSS